ncbi:uncharacterized protein EAE97_001683 [Botrytis byssoidea]|uniref:Uncharacterized protein n=1 Tax=Botrytis byssoidea TaxID=139641 RepID=A0A9P5M5M6_9HELO|nr:uncharacterized protein EAE97_001683 [Botrytis byssoidea]KAF7952186.1 hypothetical protein EAE97_001683 [Botrytis byssoidea]
MRERSDASYHPATFQAPNLKDQKSFTFPANYTGEPAPLVKETGVKQRPVDTNKRKDNAKKKQAPKTSNADTGGSSRGEDRIDRIDFAHNKKASKTSNPHVRGSSRNGGLGDLNKPAKKARKNTVKKGDDAAGKRNGSRFGGVFSSLKSTMTRD